MKKNQMVEDHLVKYYFLASMSLKANFLVDVIYIIGILLQDMHIWDLLDVLFFSILLDLFMYYNILVVIIMNYISDKSNESKW